MKGGEADKRNTDKKNARKGKRKTEGHEATRKKTRGGGQTEEAHKKKQMKTREKKQKKSKERKRPGQQQRKKGQGPRGNGTAAADRKGSPPQKKDCPPNRLARSQVSTQKRGQPSPEGAAQPKTATRAATGKVRSTRTRPGRRPARPRQDKHAQAHVHRTRAWRPRTRKKGVGVRKKQSGCTGRGPRRMADGTGNRTRQRPGPHAPPPQRTKPKTSWRDPPGTTRSRGPKAVRRGARPGREKLAGRQQEPGSRPASTCPAQPQTQSPGEPRITCMARNPAVMAQRRRHNRLVHESKQTGSGGAQRGGATRHARQACRGPQPRHRMRCQAITAAGCGKPGGRTQAKKSTQSARQHPRGAAKQARTRLETRKVGGKSRPPTTASQERRGEGNTHRHTPQAPIFGELPPPASCDQLVQLDLQL